MYVRQPKIGLGLGCGITWPDGPTLILDFIGTELSLGLDFTLETYTSLDTDPVAGGFVSIQVWS